MPEFDFKKAAKAKPSFGRKPYLEPGIEAGLMITKAEYKEGFKGKNYVFEFKVLDGKPIATGAVAPLVGSERAYICDMASEYGEPNLMSIVQALEGGALTGLSEEAKKALVAAGKSMDQIREADEDAQGLSMKQILTEAVGAQLRVSTNGVMTGKGQPFTALSWGHVPGQTIESIRAERVKLSAPK